jgi:hypothetical protein
MLESVVPALLGCVGAVAASWIALRPGIGPAGEFVGNSPQGFRVTVRPTSVHRAAPVKLPRALHGAASSSTASPRSRTDFSLRQRHPERRIEADGVARDHASA